MKTHFKCNVKQYGEYFVVEKIWHESKEGAILELKPNLYSFKNTVLEEIKEQVENFMIKSKFDMNPEIELVLINNL